MVSLSKDEYSCRKIMQESTMISISIIIVSWNSFDFLKQCINSIYEYIEDIEFEIIIIDNASTDDSPKLIEKYFPDVTLIKNTENLGFARANNIGIKASRGEYLFLVNSDILLFNKIFKRIINHMNDHPSIGLLGPKILNPDHSLQLSARKFPNFLSNMSRVFAVDRIFHNLNFHSHKKIEEVDILSGCFWVARKKAIDEIGLLDDQFFIYGEDKDWSTRFRKGGWKVLYFPEVEVIHFGGRSSSNAPIKFYLEMQKANLIFWRKHFSRFTYIWVILTSILHQSIRFTSYSLLNIIQSKKREVFLYKIDRSKKSIKLYIQYLCSISNNNLNSRLRI
jgi:GT2 family glycosyltransferase